MARSQMISNQILRETTHSSSAAPNSLGPSDVIVNGIMPMQPSQMNPEPSPLALRPLLVSEISMTSAVATSYSPNLRAP